MADRGWGLPLVTLFVLVSGGYALACPSCSAGWLSPLPGLALVGGYIAFVLPILGGLIERPFYTLAGVDKRALGYSIQANLFSTLLVGFVGDLVVFQIWTAPTAIWLWFPIAIVSAWLLECIWIGKPWRRRRRRFTWRWLLLANVISAVIIGLLPTLGSIIGTYGYSHFYRIRSIRESAGDIAFLAAVAVHIIAFFSTKGVEVGTIIEPVVRGFEVLPVGQAISPEPAPAPEQAKAH